ncbi:MAG TPA: CBS domain-containing protein, partial [Gaiellaceae bacterium]
MADPYSAESALRLAADADPPPRRDPQCVNMRSGTMNVQDVMTSDVVTVRPDTSLKDVAAILTERR